MVDVLKSLTLSFIVGILKLSEDLCQTLYIHVASLDLGHFRLGFQLPLQVKCVKYIKTSLKGFLASILMILEKFTSNLLHCVPILGTLFVTLFDKGFSTLDLKTNVTSKM